MTLNLQCEIEKVTADKIDKKQRAKQTKAIDPICGHNCLLWNPNLSTHDSVGWGWFAPDRQSQNIFFSDKFINGVAVLPRKLANALSASLESFVSMTRVIDN